MQWRWLLFLSIVSTNVFATDENIKATKETARRTYRSESEVRSALQECDKDQSTLNVCAEYRLLKVDQSLNELYRKKLARLHGTSSLRAFVTAQKAWLRFRDLDCKYQASAIEGGSMNSQWVLDCLRVRTDERIKHLEAFLGCNGNGCPGNQ